MFHVRRTRVAPRAPTRVLLVSTTPSPAAAGSADTAPAAGTAPTAAVTGAGRYAPSPSGDLHLGNLRTAVIAYAFARTTGRRFLLRVDDLDPQRSRREVAERQLADLRELGIDWDAAPEYQSDNHARYQQALDQLTAAGLTYECFCSRKEILEAPRAPHAPPGAYPGTCRELSPAERERRRASLPPNKVPAIRLAAQVAHADVIDSVQGRYDGDVDDMVLRRGDGAWAYNLAVVVDDAAAGIDQVVRGVDLLSSTPRQAYLAGLLDLPRPTYAHVPLAVAADGARLAKRDGGHTLAELRAAGVTAGQVLGAVGASLGVGSGSPLSLDDVVRGFDPAVLAPGASHGAAWTVPDEWS